MAVEFEHIRVEVPSGKGRQTFLRSVEFAKDVRGYGVTLNGFKLDFDSAVGSERRINIMEANVDRVRRSGRRVDYIVTCELSDWNRDDPYSGYVDVMVVAETA
ncbi:MULTISPECIES: hypothetical protein [Nocardia]|uniref:hypothetical protein n=1 Tax=Nocardia TaxID=1817 RepID=UPI002455D5E7|nr:MULTISPECIES: hypothetical protein [Nocardia]